jgi:hypothetical protein
MPSRCWVGAALVLAVLTAPGYGQVTLEWKFKEGDKFFLETTSVFHQTMKTLGKELKQDLEQTTQFSLSVLQKNDVGAVLEQKLEAISLKNLNMTGSSTNDEKFLQQLKDATFKVTVTPRGEITKFEGYDDLLKKLAGDDAKARATIQAILSEDSLKRSVGDTFGLLPAGPVKSGDKWGGDKKTELPLGPLGSFTVVKNYTYDGKETVEGKSLDKISFSGSATYAPPKMADMSVLPFQVVKGDLKAENIKGIVLFDSGAGRLAMAETTMQLKGNVTIAASGTNIDTEAQQDQTIKTRLLDKAPAPAK